MEHAYDVVGINDRSLIGQAVKLGPRSQSFDHPQAASAVCTTPQPAPPLYLELLPPAAINMNTYKHQGKHPQGIRKEGRLRRKSPCLKQGVTRLFRSAPFVPKDISPNSPLQSSTTAPPGSHKRKHSHEIHVSDGPTKKQRSAYTVGDAHTETVDDKKHRALDYWTKYKEWPKDLLEQAGTMDNQLARKKSNSTLRHKSSASSTNATEKASRENPSQSSVYRDKRFESILESQGSYLKKDEEGPINRPLCNELLDAKQTVPLDTLFSDNWFEKTCNYLSSRNEAMVLRDIGQDIVPGATTLARMGAEHLKNLAESVDELWTESIPLFSPRPQPDYSVGFSRSAFSEELQQRLAPLIGTFWDKSYYAATFHLYFPFLVCEVKCGAAALEIADRQNAHSATLAVRAVVELFRLVGRESEVDRKILAFSVSHNHNTSHIYGHYPVIDKEDTKYYRYTINNSDFMVMDGRDRWATYKFIRNVYDIWMPKHLKDLCSAIQDLPDMRESQPLSKQAVLSQRSESESVLSFAATEATTPDTPVSQSFKKPRVGR